MLLPAAFNQIPHSFLMIPPLLTNNCGQNLSLSNQATYKAEGRNSFILEFNNGVLPSFQLQFLAFSMVWRRL
ncbi:hypothetical protein Syun_021183 [Stephania yunnanensis]|uniref:Uncharacterized protein n=1 Tax=Stephania yunnanensis TaxID=152371 RepID=A0AAP0NS31_9MAGN